MGLTFGRGVMKSYEILDPDTRRIKSLIHTQTSLNVPNSGFWILVENLSGCSAVQAPGPVECPQIRSGSTSLWPLNFDVRGQHQALTVLSISLIYSPITFTNTRFGRLPSNSP